MLHIVISFLRTAAFSYFIYLLCEIKLSLGVTGAFFILFLYTRELGETIYNNTKNNQDERTN